MASAEVADGTPTVIRRYGATHHQLSAPDSRSGNRVDSGSGLDCGQAGRGDLSNIWRKKLWKLEFGCGKVAVQHLVGVVGFRCPLPYQYLLTRTSQIKRCVASVARMQI